MLPSSRTNVPGERRSVPSFDAARESRGDILSQWEPANSVPAEGAFLTAIAVAKQQATRSFELRAALSRAKLYQSTARAAYAVLAPPSKAFRQCTSFPKSRRCWK